MKKLIAVLLLIPMLSYASLFDGVNTIGDQSGETPGATCWSVAQFDLDLSNDEMLELCDGNSIAPTQCYRFAKSALRSRYLAIKTCAKAKSMMPKINCISDYSNYSPEETAEICSQI